MKLTGADTVISIAIDADNLIGGKRQRQNSRRGWNVCSRLLFVLLKGCATRAKVDNILPTSQFVPYPESSTGRSFDSVGAWDCF